MINEITNIEAELQDTIADLTKYSKKLENLIHILDRTVKSPNATNNSVMELIDDFKKHKWVEKSKLGTTLTGVHKALYRDANDKLAAKIAEQRQALLDLNPIKVPKRKPVEE